MKLRIGESGGHHRNLRVLADALRTAARTLIERTRAHLFLFVHELPMPNSLRPIERQYEDTSNISGAGPRDTITL
jgi:hypothetical protein